jgi:septin family protein
MSLPTSTRRFKFYEISRKMKRGSKVGTQSLQFIDTVGFGDSMELESWVNPIVSYIEINVCHLEPLT